MRSNPYLNVLKRSFVIGWIGGEWLAAMDLFRYSQDFKPILFLPVVAIFFRVIIFYAFLGSLIALFFGLFLCGFQYLFNLDPRSVRDWPLRLFVFFSSSIVMNQMVERLGEFHRVREAGAVLLSFGVAAAAPRMLHILRRTWRLRAGALSAFLLILGLGASFRFWQDMPTSKAIAMPSQGSFSAGRPNILWIVLDSSRADHFSCYGYPRKTTPFIDGIAQESTLYLHAFAPAPGCFASHAAMLTGLSPTVLGAGSGAWFITKFPSLAIWTWLDNQFKTIPQILGSEGFRTAGFSENAEEVSPETNLNHGFAEFEMNQEIQSLDSLFFFEMIARISPIVRLCLPWWRVIHNRLTEILLPRESMRRALGTNREVERFIDHWAPGPAPFFLFVNYKVTQDYYGSTPYFARFFKGAVKPWDWVRPDKWKIFRLWTRQDYLSPEVVHANRTLYDGDLSYVDEKVGELIGVLRQKKILDHTVVIITADHGEDLGENNVNGHGHNLFYRMLHVPLIIRYPANFPAGRRIAAPVQLTDLFPTLLDLAHVNIPSEFPLDGSSLLNGQIHSRSAFSEVFLPVIPGVEVNMQKFINKNPPLSEEAIMVGSEKSVYADGYHLILTRKGVELYDIEQDEKEVHNLAFQKSDLVKRLRRSLQGRELTIDPYWGPRFGEKAK